MKFCILFFCFFISSVSAEEVLFSKALMALQENQVEEASRLFSEFLKLNPESESGRFNLALSFYRQNKMPDPARAYWRQILFKNPYSLQTREALSLIGDKKYFWLWIPEDFILALMALSWVIFIFLKKTSMVFHIGVPLWMIVHVFSGYYFYHRFGNYGNLIQDCQVFSAPDFKAPVLFEQKSGALVKELDKKDEVRDWSHVKISTTKSGWIRSSFILSLKF